MVAIKIMLGMCYMYSLLTSLTDSAYDEGRKYAGVMYKILRILDMLWNMQVDPRNDSNDDC